MREEMEEIASDSDVEMRDLSLPPRASKSAARPRKSATRCRWRSFSRDSRSCQDTIVSQNAARISLVLA